MPHHSRRALAALPYPRLCLLALACFALSLAARQGNGEPQAAELYRATAGKGGRITVIFHGLQGRDGYLRVGLYDQPDGFPSGAPVAHKDLLLQDLPPQTPLDTLTVTFDSLRPGAYAVCAFHDRDSSGRLAQNFLGIPQEEWGMSGNPRPRFRAPRFDQARLGLGAQEAKTLLITLHK